MFGDTYSVGLVPLPLAEGLSMLSQAAGALALDLCKLRSRVVGLAYQANVGAGDAIIIVALPLSPQLELVLGKLGAELPLAAHGTFEPGRHGDGSGWHPGGWCVVGDAWWAWGGVIGG